MKKILSLLLALIMMLGVAFTLASCGEDPPPEVPDDPDVPDTPDEDKEIPKNYNWTKADNKTVNMKLNMDNVGYVNLSKRYIAGEDTDATATVDDLILQRNEAAEDTTMVKVNYSYWSVADSGWNKTDETIVEDKNSFDAASSPDIYVTAIYDCVWASFSNALANVVGKNRDNGNNYFTFLEADYDAAKDDRGYNYELMRTFSPLPDSAMFMVSSDYTIDVFRAVHAMPVSITMMESLVASDVISNYNVPDFDTNDNDVLEMEEFLAFVFDGKWTWDVMATLCAAVYVPANVDSEESFGDTRFGFYIDVSGGSSGNALTYSIDKNLTWTKTVDANGVPTYIQKDKTAYVKLAEKFEALMAVPGAMQITNTEVQDYTQLSKEEYPSLANAAISEKFGRNEVLFAENSLIGAIEFTFFQNMEGLFGIVPQPLLEAGTKDTMYTTALGNAGRVAVIGVNTDDFMEATAFLDYQSTHSGEIIARYFRSQQYESTNGEDYNIRMLEYLREILVDQEAHIMNLHCQNYKLTPEEKAKYFVGDPSLYSQTTDDGKNYIGITSFCWRMGESSVSNLDKYYSTQFMNTINAMYKLTVDRYIKVAETL